MKNQLSVALLASACLIAGTTSNLVAADVNGTWKSEFDSQIGRQSYTFTFKQDGATLTGKANAEINGDKHETELKEGKIDGETVSFVEMLTSQGNNLRIVGQSLNIGLSQLETFAHVGGFSSAPNTYEFGGISPDTRLLADPEAAKEKLKLLWVACGNKDGLIRVSQGVHKMLKENGVPHVWHVDSHAHDDAEWSSNLYLFAQHLFK